MPLGQRINGSNTLYKSNMDVWSILRWISASTKRFWHYDYVIIYTSQVTLILSQIRRQLGRCYIIRVHPCALERAYQWLKHFLYVQYGCMKYSKAVWVGYQPQTWHYGIMYTPQLTMNYQIWGQLGRWIVIRVHTYAPETACQWLKYFACI